MSNYIHLIGTEAITSASQRMVSAAESIAASMQQLDHLIETRRRTELEHLEILDSLIKKFIDSIEKQQCSH